MPKGIKWAKEAQDGMRINPTDVLGNMNWVKEKYMVGLKEAKQARVKW